jgi:hypothetical protein
MVRSGRGIPVPQLDRLAGCEAMGDTEGVALGCQELALIRS